MYTSIFVVITFHVRAVTFEEKITTCLNMILITVSSWVIVDFR